VEVLDLVSYLHVFVGYIATMLHCSSSNKISIYLEHEEKISGNPICRIWRDAVPQQSDMPKESIYSGVGHVPSPSWPILDIEDAARRFFGTES
jgi:hypothetical protein